ncbi:unnamed protein product [Ceutorhynchus assimilis]|uniref:Regulatory protein zeste n=1 Tax=Ceutorhynchus assimilis TaxID=467358 RepID=A0A9N9Q8V9_9CUCU|nr:unnamed protein product [Ceutorhynchus assimilis]
MSTMTEENKRRRSVNFTMREQNLLFSIALKHKNVIENKQTNATTNCEKNEVWSEVAKEFNATSTDFNNRTVEQLKRCYENRRQSLRKQKAEVRQECLKTGGGPPPEQKEEPAALLVLATMDPLTVVGDTNTYDSDSVSTIIKDSGHTEENEIELIFEVPENQQPGEKGARDEDHENQNFREDIENDTYIPQKKDWKKYHSSDLKRPLNPALLRSNAATAGTKKTRQADSQLESENLQTRSEHHSTGVTTRTGVGNRRGLDRGIDRRRPTATVVKALASSALA